MGEDEVAECSRHDSIWQRLRTSALHQGVDNRGRLNLCLPRMSRTNSSWYWTDRASSALLPKKKRRRRYKNVRASGRHGVQMPVSEDLTQSRQQKTTRTSLHEDEAPCKCRNETFCYYDKRTCNCLPRHIAQIVRKSAHNHYTPSPNLLDYSDGFWQT